VVAFAAMGISVLWMMQGALVYDYEGDL
jgi:hypothetical protein